MAVSGSFNPLESPVSRRMSGGWRRKIWMQRIRLEGVSSGKSPWKLEKRENGK